MSENFGNGGYEAYFKILEENLEKSRMNNPTENEQLNRPVKTVQKIRKTRKNNLKSKKLIALFLSVVLIVSAVMVFGNFTKADKIPKKPQPLKNTEQTEQKQENIVKKSFAFTDETADIPKSNDAEFGIIINKETGNVVAERKATERAFPASTTKIMTLLTAVDLISDYNDTFTMSYEITDPLFVEEASVAGFLDGEKVNMTDLLYGTILPSGADAAMGLAVKLSGSEEAFVELMNQKVAELGLSGTHFDNVTGLHSENNYSTAYDMAIILDTALENEVCKKILSTYQYTTAKTPEHPDGISLSSTLFTYMYGTEPETATILGGKTGYVNESGYCIASYGSNNESGNEYIVITFNNSARMPAFFGQIDLYKEFAK